MGGVGLFRRGAHARRGVSLPARTELGTVKRGLTDMDPNANLAEQLRITDRINRDAHSKQDVWRLAELVEALNDWLASGGFPPAWVRR